jgi:hypothetical protein
MIAARNARQRREVIDALGRVARNERKRRAEHARKMAVAQAVLEVLEEETRALKWPADVITTVRVLDRAGAFGTGLPAENTDVYSQSRQVPLDPDTQAVVTAIIDECPTRMKRVLIEIWFRGAPTWHVAKLMRMTARTFGRYKITVVRDLKKRFLASKHSDLIKLVQARP